MSQNVFFFRCEFLIEIWLLNKNWIQKPEFLENKFSPKNDYSKSFVFDIFRDDKFSIQNLKFWNFFFQFFIKQEHFSFRIWLFFFLENSFQTLIFNEKDSYKVMLFKMSTKSEQLVVLRGANRVKTLFLRCDVFIEIWSSMKIEFKI